MVFPAEIIIKESIVWYYVSKTRVNSLEMYTTFRPGSKSEKKIDKPRS